MIYFLADFHNCFLILFFYSELQMSIGSAYVLNVRNGLNNNNVAKMRQIHEWNFKQGEYNTHPL